MEVEQRGSASQTSASAFTDLAEVVLRIGEDPVAAIEILDSNRHQRVLVPATHRLDGRLKPQKKNPPGSLERRFTRLPYKELLQETGRGGMKYRESRERTPPSNDPSSRNLWRAS